MDETMNALSDLIARSSALNSPGTYVDDDGLLRCVSCHQPREHRITAPGDFYGVIVPCVCPCIQRQRKADSERLKAQEKDMRVQSLMQLGFPERDRATYGFELDDSPESKISVAMRKYADNFEKYRKGGTGLLLYGDYGTGKTFYAGCIVNALIQQGRPAMLTNLSRLVNQIQARDMKSRQDFIDELSELELIALDDFGVERDTEYMSEQVELLIDQFYRAKIPMIVTSNHSPKWMLQDKDIRRGRMYDRILERCHPVNFGSESKRMKTARSAFARTKKELGL